MVVPVPGASELKVVADVGRSVVQGLSTPSQPSPWPNARDDLLELLAILDDWYSGAEATTRYAEQLAKKRSPPVVTPTVGGYSVSNGAIYSDSNPNFAPGYLASVSGDIRRVLSGRISPLGRLRSSTRRRASRRGLRTVLLTYSPSLLEQFDAATAARKDWVERHNKDFDRWFDETHTDKEVKKLLTDMIRTQISLLRVMDSLRKFIQENFPLTKT